MFTDPLDTKQFDAAVELYDLDTFYGRYRHFRLVLSPFNIFHSNESIKQYQKNIDDYTLTKVSKFTSRELWQQYYVIKSNLHPETKEAIQMPFRWSCFVPMNVPLLFGIGLLPPTPFNQAIFQSLNQAYNFGVNLFNASASNPMNNQEVMTSASLAIGSALLVSVGLRKALIKIKSQNQIIKG
jgi:hypothetical protein